MQKQTLFILAVLLCATNTWAQRSGQSMSVQTGVVISARSVELASEAGRGAAVGGIAGYAMTSSGQSSSRRARNTILGAGIGGAMSNRAQGSRNGMQYTVEIAPGQQITVVTDQTEVRVGDCVNVEQAGSGTANVRRVSQAMCQAAATDTVGEEITQEYDRLAGMCLAAKERMMEAETDEALEVALIHQVDLGARALALAVQRHGQSSLVTRRPVGAGRVGVVVGNRDGLVSHALAIEPSTNLRRHELGLACRAARVSEAVDGVVEAADPQRCPVVRGQVGVCC